MNISLGGDETLHVELEARKLDILSKSFGLEAENCLYLGNELIYLHYDIYGNERLQLFHLHLCQN